MSMTLINKITEYKKSVETWCGTMNNSSQGKGVLNKVLCGKANTFTLQHTIFDRNGTPFEYLLIEKWYPITYLV